MDTTQAPPTRGLFARGMRLVTSYVRLHPRPFAAAVAGAALFAVSSLLLAATLGRATDEVLRPAFDGGVSSREVWLAAGALMLFGCGRALGIMIRRYYSGVSGERVMATLRGRISDRYRDLALQYHRETPTGELLAHMEADVKAAVDVYWPVPFAIGVILLVVLALISLFATDVWLAMIGLLLFPALALMNRSFARRMEVPARAAQERIGEVSSVAHESIDGALVVKTLGSRGCRDRPAARSGSSAARRACQGRHDPGHLRCCARLPACPGDHGPAGHGLVARERGRHDTGRADRRHRPVRSARVADAVHRVDPGRTAAGRRRIRPDRGGVRRAGDRHAGSRAAGAARRTAGHRGPPRRAHVRRHPGPARRDLRRGARRVGGDRRAHR